MAEPAALRIEVFPSPYTEPTEPHVIYRLYVASLGFTWDGIKLAIRTGLHHEGSFAYGVFPNLEAAQNALLEILEDRYPKTSREMGIEYYPAISITVTPDPLMYFPRDGIFSVSSEKAYWTQIPSIGGQRPPDPFPAGFASVGRKDARGYFTDVQTGMAELHKLLRRKWPQRRYTIVPAA